MSKLDDLKALVAAHDKIHDPVARFLKANKDLLDDPGFAAYLPELIKAVQEKDWVGYALDVACCVHGWAPDDSPIKELLIPQIIDLLPAQMEDDLDVHVLGTIAWLVEHVPESDPEFPRVLTGAQNFLEHVLKDAGGLVSARHYAENQFLRWPVCGPKMLTLASDFLTAHPAPGADGSVAGGPG